MNLKEIQEGFVGGFEKRKGKREMISYYNHKIKKNPKNSP